MEKIAIFGAGGFGREVKLIIDALNESDDNKYQFIGFYDDGIPKGTIVNHFPVLGGVREINEADESLSLVLAIGDPLVKKSILSKINNDKIHYPTLIHPKASISSDFVNIGKGCIICEGTIVTCNIEIHDFVILNLCCTVGHDTIIQDYCAFMPSVNISGEVVIGKGVYVGTGTKIINQLMIGENVTIGAGAVVIRNIPDNVTVVGNPGRVLER